MARTLPNLWAELDLAPHKKLTDAIVKHHTSKKHWAQVRHQLLTVFPALGI